MRLLFFLLLLANLGFLGWLWVGPAPVSPNEVSQQRAGQLQLVAEARDDVDVDSTNASAGAECFSSGPIEDLERARQEKRALERQGKGVSLRQQDHLEPLGWWVYLPPAASLQAAQETGRELARRGVTDYVLVVGAEKANAISLGLYAEHDAARARAAQLKQLGFAPLLEQRYTKRSFAILGLRSPVAPAPSGPGVRWQPIDCQALNDSLP